MTNEIQRLKKISPLPQELTLDELLILKRRDGIKSISISSFDVDERSEGKVAHPHFAHAAFVEFEKPSGEGCFLVYFYSADARMFRLDICEVYPPEEYTNREDITAPTMEKAHTAVQEIAAHSGMKSPVMVREEVVMVSDY